MKSDCVISFIVIGRNEAQHIGNCFISVYKTIKQNDISNYEVIYVDSNSSDGSINIAKSFRNIIIYKISGQINSAIARNIGADKSNGKILVFIDGDMEIIPSALSEIISNKNGLIYPFTSGDFENIYLNKNTGILTLERYHNNRISEFDYVCGGIFFIDRYLWFLLGGMRNCFRRNQDLDFGLRASKMGFPLLRKNVVIAKHQTVGYHCWERFLDDVLKGNYLYRGLLYRKNIFNPYMYKKYILREVSLYFLIITIIVSISQNHPIFILSYFFVVMAKIISKKQKSLAFYIKYMLIYPIIDFNTLVGMICFYPKMKNKIKFEYISGNK